MNWKKSPILRISVAVICLLLGIAGLLLPLAPGIPFVIAGLYLINPAWCHKVLVWCTWKWHTFWKK